MTAAATSVATITDHDTEQVQRANASGSQPVVFVHGLWLAPSSWTSWSALFRQEGYAALAPGWPGEPDTTQDARARPDALAGTTIAQIADHLESVISLLHRKPAIVGHSFGGLLTEILAGRGLAEASVAISPAPFRGVLPLPISALRSSQPVLSNPANRNRSVSLTYEQFRYAFANAVNEDEARELYDTYAVPGPGHPIFQAAAANLNPWTEVKVDTKNPARGPLLVISTDGDHTVPWAIANASYRRQRRNPSPTEIVKLPGHGHALTIDSGWREIADRALEFIRRFAPADANADT